MKKIVLILSVFLHVNLFAQENQENTTKKDILVLSGPISSVSHPFYKIIEDNVLSDIAKKVEFREWKNPDELRALVLKGEVDFVALPVNIAAILYNKEQHVKLLSVSIWGIMTIVSTDKNVKKIEDLKHEEVLVPFRADMPDIILQALLRKALLDIKKDIKLNYVSTPVDAVQMLVTKKAKHALLVEPVTSMAMLKTSSFPKILAIPTFYRAIDLQDEWGRLYETANRVPQAGIGVVANVDEHVQKRVLEEYEKALNWYRQNPSEAGKLAAKHVKMFNEDMIKESILHVRFENVKIEDAKEELERFFKVLYEINPKIIGEKIPDNGFYEK
ncbi:MAG: ABC transporter substrate-binding protein [Campylobacteraceae bacterium]|jgi:NitT/TauT family transport system substrate-binding protein|nr:ABC transporter substrate-binding protein [Campylobacteraceae bacterium]